MVSVVLIWCWLCKLKLKRSETMSLLYLRLSLTMHLSLVILLVAGQICRSGGIGRRARLKIVYPEGYEGSIPSFGTHLNIKRRNIQVRRLCL
jgi:hypothetical protein